VCLSILAFTVTALNIGRPIFSGAGQHGQQRRQAIVAGRPLAMPREVALLGRGVDSITGYSKARSVNIDVVIDLV
jgi:hypothetical protein